MKTVIGGYLCRYYDIYLNAFGRFCCLNYYTSNICHLLISGVGITISTDILCESDDCHCNIPASC